MRFFRVNGTGSIINLAHVQAFVANRGDGCVYACMHGFDLALYCAPRGDDMYAESQGALDDIRKQLAHEFACSEGRHEIIEIRI